MPITLNLQRGEKQIVQQVDFGTGDIFMLGAREPNGNFEDQLWLVQHEPKPKEVWQTYQDPNYPVGINTDDMPQKPAVVLVFHNRDSLASLIRSLTEIYDQMPIADLEKAN